MTIMKLAFIGFVSSTLVVLHSALTLAALFTNSQTCDEGVNIAGGYSILASGRSTINIEHPPLAKLLYAIPVRMAEAEPANTSFLKSPPGTSVPVELEFPISAAFLYGGPVDGIRLLRLARIPAIIMGTLVVLFVGLWAYRLWGQTAGLVAMSLAAVEPTLIGHASLAGLDVPSALWILLTCYFLWEHTRSRKISLLVGAAIALGAALSTKFSNLLLIPITAVLIFAAELRETDVPIKRRAVRVFARVAIVVGVAPIVIWASYLFGRHAFVDWTHGLLWQLQHNNDGHPAFALGRYSRQGFWWYFPLAFAVKTPLGILSIFALSLIFWRQEALVVWRDAVFLFAPPALIMAQLMACNVNIGVRYLLPAIPFILVASAHLVTATFRPAIVAALVGVPLFATIASSLYRAPRQLAYFNELIPKDSRSEIVSDSNIDWGQDLMRLQKWWDEHSRPRMYLSYWGATPARAYGISYEPLAMPESMPVESIGSERPRLLAISLGIRQNFLGQDRAPFAWLDGRDPLVTVGDSITVYDVSDAAAHVGIARLYAKGFPPLAPPAPALAIAEAQTALAISPMNTDARALLRALELRPEH